MPLKNSSLLRGLYVITDPGLANLHALSLAKQVELALRGGARLVQYRNKSFTLDKQTEEARQILDICRRYQVPLLINDNVELALAVGADGVHLGQSDSDLGEARQRLGSDAIIGVTCHDRLELAQQAEANGADYVAFGRFFTSHTKPEAPPAAIDILHQAHQTLKIPIVAIGGITPDNGASLIRAGADMLAVIHGVFGQDDIEQAAAAYARLFEAKK